MKSPIMALSFWTVSGVNTNFSESFPYQIFKKICPAIYVLVLLLTDEPTWSQKICARISNEPFLISPKVQEL